MLALLSRLFAPAPEALRAHGLYIATVARSRNPFFYDRLGVPDTLDGRFEMIALHLFLLLRRLRAEKGREAAGLSRALSEALFDDMDRSLREMGVGDTGVGRRIRHMADAFYGRVSAYEAALDGRESLRAAIARNVYGAAAAEAEEGRISELAYYVLRTSAALQAHPAERLAEAFAPPLQVET